MQALRASPGSPGCRASTRVTSSGTIRRKGNRMRNEVVSAALEACPAEARECLLGAMGGQELTFEQGLQLATGEGAAVEALQAVADQLRRETVGEAITYVVNRNINFTNVCFVGCSFCGFARGPGASDAYSHSPDEVARRAVEAWERGATEV